MTKWSPLPGVVVRHLRGRIVRSLQVAGHTSREIGWDGRNDAGDQVGPGVFFYNLDDAPETGRIILIR